MEDEKKITRREAVNEAIQETVGLVIGPFAGLIGKEKEEESTPEKGVENTVPREKPHKPSK